MPTLDTATRGSMTFRTCLRVSLRSFGVGHNCTPQWRAVSGPSAGSFTAPWSFSAGAEATGHMFVPRARELPPSGVLWFRLAALALVEINLRAFVTLVVGLT